MGNFIYTQNSFALGEVSPNFFATQGINGLSKLENMDVLSSGAITRRKGLEHIIELDRKSRLVPFSVNESENYLLALMDGHIKIYKDNELVQDILSPWSYEDIKKLQYAQRFGTIIFVHPDYQPQVLKKHSRFELSLFTFLRNDENMTINIPFMKFDDNEGIRITVTESSLGNNFATFTTNKDYWSESMLYLNLFLINKQWVVFEYINPRTVIVSTSGGYTLPKNSVSGWHEAAFSDYRGWPCSISFHQDRLVFGGSKSWASGIWMSKVGVHNNFSVGTGLDDDAIFITLLSEQRQQICTVVSSDNLQILTNSGEWAISNKPLTASSVNIKQHTSVGSLADRYLPPQKIEGSTTFISGSKKDIRELSLDELGENYNANDLCALSKHLMNEPVDITYNDTTKQLFVVMETGEIAVLNKNTILGISAWAIYKTQGDFQSVAVMDGQTYASVKRGDNIAIERFSEDCLKDSGEFGFSYTASGLPFLANKHSPQKIRVRKISARILDTKSIFINGTRAILPNEIYKNNEPGYTGDVSINSLGTTKNNIAPLWTIQGSEALPLTLLSVSVNGWYLI